MTGFVEQVVSYQSAMPEFTQLQRATHSVTLFVETVCMPRCLLLYTSGHGHDWNA